MTDGTQVTRPLTGQSAIVTGSGRGIGAAIAAHLADLGASVIVNYLHNEEPAITVRDGIRNDGGQAEVVQADAGTPEGARSLVSAAQEAFGRLDILVSNAGPLFRPVPLTEMSWDEFGGLVKADLSSAFNVTQAVLPVMIEQQFGRIIYIGSGSAHHPSPGLAHHGSSRAALTTFATYVAKEMAQNGITANVVSPGIVLTDRTAAASDAVTYMGSQTPVGRIAEPDDVARAVGFFAADSGGFYTGTNFPVDGGLTMG
jgi:3-oxoacyl-[acyl-carrier protein] reductase